MKSDYKLLRHLIKHINTDEETGDQSIEAIIRLSLAETIYDEICMRFAEAIKDIIPDFKYQIGCDDWNTICLTSKSHHTKDSEHTIPLDSAIYEAIPEEYRTLFVFKSDGYYVSEQEARDIKRIIEKIHEEEE